MGPGQPQASIEKTGDGDSRAVLLRLFVAQRGLAAERPAGTPANILEASIPIFALRGYAGTSMRDIASEVGIKAASIYEYYNGKEKLLLAAIAQLMSQFYEFVLETLDPDADGRDQLRTVLERHIIFQSRHEPIASAWDALFDLQSISEKVADVSSLSSDRDLYHHFIGALVAEQRPADGQPKARADAMISICNSVARWSPQEIDERELIELGWGYVAAILDAT
jgi:AcrR family transcriptional regulator